MLTIFLSPSVRNAKPVEALLGAFAGYQTRMCRFLS